MAHQPLTGDELMAMSMEEYARAREGLLAAHFGTRQQDPTADGVVTVEPRPPDPLDVAIADPMVSM
jgi:hypothetical protein